MKAGFIALLLIGLGVVSASAQQGKTKVIQMRDGKGDSVGMTVISPAGKGVSVKLSLKGLTPGNMPCTSTKSPSVKGRTSNPPAHISIRRTRSMGRKIRKVRMRAI